MCPVPSNKNRQSWLAVSVESCVDLAQALSTALGVRWKQYQNPYAAMRNMPGCYHAGAMRRLALLALVGAAACANAADKGAAKPFSATLAPGKIHEECLKVEGGQKSKYHWKSSAPVDFNIHYHRGPEVFYPVKRRAMRGDDDTFAPKNAE